MNTHTKRILLNTQEFPSRVGVQEPKSTKGVQMLHVKKQLRLANKSQLLQKPSKGWGIRGWRWTGMENHALQHIISASCPCSSIFFSARHKREKLIARDPCRDWFTPRWQTGALPKNLKPLQLKCQYEMFEVHWSRKKPRHILSLKTHILTFLDYFCPMASFSTVWKSHHTCWCERTRLTYRQGLGWGWHRTRYLHSLLPRPNKEELPGR